jgi:DNA-binding transcriptional LysR family regulator
VVVLVVARGYGVAVGSVTVRYDLLDLRLFRQVVAEGSITAGAERMHLSLPSASARVRALEQHAGVALLVRGRRGVRPTPAGAALARHAEEVLDGLARLEGAVAAYRRAPATPLVLLAGSSAMRRLVPRALVTFLVAHPDVGLAVVPSHVVDPARGLAVCALDEPFARRTLTLRRGARADPGVDDLAEHLHRAAAEPSVD